MKNLISDGTKVTYINTTEDDIKSGDVVAFGARIGVADVDIPAGAKGTVSVTREYNLAAVNDAGFTLGDALYWDTDAKKLTKTSTDNVPAGMCSRAKESAATTARVIIG